jgi:DNA polymerase sigma
LTSDAFSFNHQIELLLMLRSEILKCPMSWTILCDLGGGNQFQLQTETLHFLASIAGKEDLSLEQSSFISKVSTILRRCFGATASLAIVGSSACGLGSVDSDLDLTILTGCAFHRCLTTTAKCSYRSSALCVSDRLL